MSTKSKAQRNRSNKNYHVTEEGVNRNLFEEARNEEIEMVQKLQCFQIVPRENAEGHRIYQPAPLTKLDRMVPNAQGAALPMVTI